MHRSKAAISILEIPVRRNRIFTRGIEGVTIAARAQRGQTLPFWVIGVLITLSLAFFLANYVNMVAWQIRAQNAADSAASGALSVQTNVLNEY